MSQNNERQDPRLSVELSVQLLDGDGAAGLTTIDVSRRGLFVHTLHPRPLRQLVRLRIDPGGDIGPIEGHGMVVRLVDQEEADRVGGEPGMGVEFYGFGGEPLIRWNQLIDGLEGGTGEAPRRSQLPPSNLQPLECDAAHKLSSRPNVLLLLAINNVEQLYEIRDHHLVAPSLFIQTTVRLADDTGVDLRIAHPLSRDIYDLRGKVAGFSEDSKNPGLVVELTPGVETREDEFRRFIDAGLPAEELALELVAG